MTLGSFCPCTLVLFWSLFLCIGCAAFALTVASRCLILGRWYLCRVRMNGVAVSLRGLTCMLLYVCLLLYVIHGGVLDAWHRV
jgi:hypothetical protein